MSPHRSDDMPEATRARSVKVQDVEFRVRADDARQSFWNQFSAGYWEPHTLRVFRRFLEPAASCIDIGAWIGPTTLFAGRLARRVHAFEPDPIAHSELVANLAVNPDMAERISLHRLCIAREPGPAELFAGGMYFGGTARFGDTMSSILPTVGNREQPRCQVEGVRLEQFMANNEITDCRFIKMDVEGAEFCVIPSRWRLLAEYGMPTLCLSFHAPVAAQREELIGACLEELHNCYRWIYSAVNGMELIPAHLMKSVPDWGDQTPGSPWLALERLLGDGIVASNEEWRR
jgi:FkbM family methyltransferase